MADKDGIADIIKNIQADMTTIVRDEIALVKAELLPQAKAIGVGAGMFGAAGYLAITASTLLFFGFSWWWAVGFAAWFGLDTLAAATCGFFTMAVILLVLAGVLILIGKAKMSFSGPKLTIDSVEQSVAAIRGAVDATTQDIAAKPLLRKRAGTPELSDERDAPAA